MTPTGGPREPVRLRLRTGEVVTRPVEAGAHMELYVEAIHSGRPGLVEMVAAERTAEGRLRMKKRKARQNFLDAGDRGALRQRAEVLSRAKLKVFATPATLTSPEPGNDAVAESQVVWIDVDEPANVERLWRFAHRPHMVVASGGSGGVHAYWVLERPVPGAAAESANRRLAEALGGDRQSTNRARIMRLPGTRNRKRHPPSWCRVVMCDLARPGYDVGELCEGLADPHEGAARAGTVGYGEADDPFKRIPAVEYFQRLAGLEVPRDRRVSCPHPDYPDRDPSCHVGGRDEFAFKCHSCGVAGAIYDLASIVEGGPWGHTLRDEAFKRARERVREAFPEVVDPRVERLDVRRRRQTPSAAAGGASREEVRT